MASPVDVDGLPNHVKYCVSVLSLQWANIRTSRSEFPTIGIRAHGLKVCLILLKNESCQNCVLTIPLCRGGSDEATGENGVEIERRTWPHAPTRWRPTRADAPHASSSPGWAGPNPNTS